MRKHGKEVQPWF